MAKLISIFLTMATMIASTGGGVCYDKETQQTQQIKVGEIEFFGVGSSERQKAESSRQKAVSRTRKEKSAARYGSEELEQLRRALPVKEGDPLGVETVAATRDPIKVAVARTIGGDPTDVSLVCCDDHGDLIIFIGLPGPAYRPFRYNPTPGPKIRLHPPANAGGTDKRPRPPATAGGTDKRTDPPANAGRTDKTLPPEIVALTEQADEMTVEAVRIEPREDRSQGYALSLYPPMRAMQMRIREYALGHGAWLRRVLSMSTDAKQRRAAAHALGYASQSRSQIVALAKAARDSDVGVRNNAMRALGVLAQSSATLAARIPAASFVSMLSSGLWLDRNKAAFLLSVLTATRDPLLLPVLRKRALEPLIEMARWRDTSHARNARVILGRVAGIDEMRLQKLASEGPVEEIVKAVRGN
jgi:hypothetical protein